MRTVSSSPLHVVALLVLFAFTSTAHECIHDKLKTMPGYKEPEVINVSYPLPSTGRGFAAQQTTGGTFESIRITVVFDPATCPGSANCGHCTAAGQSVTTFQGSNVLCTEDDVLTTIKRDYIMNTLMVEAKNFLQRALKVVRVSGNLIVGGSGTCGSNPGVPIPSSDSSTGRASTDFLIYVTAVPMPDPESATVAWALACRFDSNNRPLVGHVNWVPKRLTNAAVGNSVKQDEDVSTGVHELSHALGFSAPFFSSNGYLNAAGTGYTTGGTSTTTSAALGKSVTKMTSPRVLTQARAYFDCGSLDGVEIEDQGGSGTQGSHWEKRILYQEYMNGVGSNIKSFYSAITLAFFEDTGHYRADYTAASSGMNWGRNAGCSFLNTKCDATFHQDRSLEFCRQEDSSINMCTHDRLGIGQCDVYSYNTDLPAHFQYFTSANKGARVQVADFCPTVIPFSNRVCIDPSTTDVQDIYGNDYGSSSRCYDSNLKNANYPAPEAISARCFLTTCSSTGAILLNIDGTTVRCPSDGTAGAADLSPLGSAFRGYINCPPASVVCVSNPSVPTTPAPPTPPPTPLPPGDTFAPAPITRQPPTPPPPLPTDCGARAACALGVQNMLPRCRALAEAVVDCFGTNCDTEMRSWLSTYGFVEHCADRATFVTECQEGTLGVTEVCNLLGGAASTSVFIALTVAALLAALLLST